jgi:hypothetical protein
LPAQIKTNIEDMSDEFTTTKKIIKAFWNLRSHVTN